MRPSISVVIPSLGRPELAAAVRSVQQQTLAPLEVLVVDDSVTGRVVVDEPGPAEVLVVRTGGGAGAAGARNAGLERARGDLIAFLDDDDLWLPHHLESAAALLHQRPDVDVYACAARVRTGDAERVEPTVRYSGTGSLPSFYFGRTVWARRRRRIMTPTLVFRRAVAQLRMDPSLDVMEDLWWLMQVEQAGHRVLQTADVAVVVHADAGREDARLPLERSLHWADRLDTLHPGTGTSYLVGHLGRQLARSRRPDDLAKVRQAVHERGPVPLDLRLVLGLERLLART